MQLFLSWQMNRIKIRFSYSLIWNIIITCLTFVTGLAIFLNYPVRPLVLFIFLLICPGIPFILFLKIENRFAEFILGITLSLIINTALVTSMVFSKLWYPKWGLGILISISIGCAITHIVLFLRSPFSKHQSV